MYAVWLVVKKIGLMVCLALLMALGGCIGTNLDDVQLDVEEIEAGSQSGVEEFRTETVRDAEDWERLYAEHRPDAEPPNIDFSESMVLGVFGGENPNDCHRVEVVDIGLGVGELVVKVERAVAEDRLCGHTVTYPYHMVRVDKVDLDVAFQVVEG